MRRGEADGGGGCKSGWGVEGGRAAGGEGGGIGAEGTPEKVAASRQSRTAEFLEPYL